MDHRPQPSAPAVVGDRGVDLRIGADRVPAGRTGPTGKTARAAGGRRWFYSTGQPSAVNVRAGAVLDHAAWNIGDQSAVTAAAAGHRGLRRLLPPAVAGRPRPVNRRQGSNGPPSTPTGSAWLSPLSPPPASTVKQAAGAVGLGFSTAGWAASAALAFAAVAEREFVVYASFGPAAEPQVIGVASSATRAEELAERELEGPLRVAIADLAGVGQRPLGSSRGRRAR
jgi:hypothetical protein